MKTVFDFIYRFTQKNPEPLIGQELAAAYNESRKRSMRGSFCYAPSVNMLFSQDGTVRVCCHNTDFIIGKYPDQSLNEIWNSAKANEMREYMRRYDLLHGCGVCGFDVNRRSFDELRSNQFDKVPRHPDYPTQMEFLVSNQCNLECVMCSGEYSSLIRKNRERLPALITPYDREFLRQIEEFIPHLFEARFSGSGEPFSIDMNFEIWEMIIRLNPKCIIYVHTNGTILTDRVKDVLKRGKFKIGLSLDSLQKETYEAIRLNANFDKVMENVLFFNEYSRKMSDTFAFTIATCVMRQNWHELPHLIEFCNKLNVLAMFHKVWFPAEHALHNLKQEQLAEIYNYLSGFDFPSDTCRQKRNREHYRYFTSVIKQWSEEAFEREAEGRRVQSRIAFVRSLPVSELSPYLRSKLKNCVANIQTSENEKTELLNLALNKFETLLNSFESEPDREKILQWSCIENTESVLASLKNYPLDYLAEQAKKALKLEL